MKLLSKLSGVLVLLILVVLSLVDVDGLDLTSKWVPFLGRFHPVLLHLPIGIFAAVVLLEAYLFVKPVSRVPEKIHFLLSAAFYSTVFSALFGIFLSWEGGYEGDAVNFHKWAGVVTAGLILALDWLARTRESNPDKLPTAYLGGLVVTIIAMTITGHQGGNLTHGSGFLTQHNPFAADKEVVEMTADTPVFISHIQPVLEDYCIQCHNHDKEKGELRLDTFEMIMAGGVNGDALVPGDSEASSMIHRIHLPMENEDHMPPQGKPQPTEEVVQLLSWWIDQGASETATQGEMEITAEIAPHFMEIETLDFQTREEVEAQMDALEIPATTAVHFLALDDHRLGVRANKAEDADVLALLPLKANIVELNLGGSSITDASLDAVGQMVNLTHLHLNNTAVTDGGIEKLVDLYQLEYINLYGNDIGDSSLQVLRRLKALKKIFLWETNVTKEAVAALYKSLFPAVQSDKLRMEIQQMEKDRDNLDVDIVSAFDFGIQPLEVVQTEEPASASISGVMVDYHKGKEALAVQAREGNAQKADLENMLEAYKGILDLTPPKGEVDAWKLKINALIDSTQDLIDDKEGAVAAYKTAVNCKACHTDHRSD